MKERLHAFVSGRVQGVGFRYFAYDHAQELGLKGWVKNMADGRVELLAEGETEDLEKMLAWLKRGPSSAKVTEVRSSFSPARNEFSHFGIEHW